MLKLIKMGVHPVLVYFGKCAVHAANGRDVQSRVGGKGASAFFKQEYVLSNVRKVRVRFPVPDALYFVVVEPRGR